jgi:hypothetical protein
MVKFEFLLNFRSVFGEFLGILLSVVGPHEFQCTFD